MKLSKTLVSIVLALSLLSSLVYTNVGAQNDDEPRWGGTIIQVMADNPQSLNPALTSALYAQFVSSNIFNALTTDVVTESGAWIQEPSLAKSWDISADGLTYTYYLRDDVLWHDGEKFTSADVKFSFERVIIPLHSAGQATWYMVDSITTPDDYTVVFHLDEPYAAFMMFQSLCYGAIVAKHVYTHPDGTLYTSDEIKEQQFNVSYCIGTGPFMIEEFVKGSHVSMVRNPNYFREGLPYLDKVIYKIVPMPEGRTLALETGEGDVIPMMLSVSDAPILNATQPYPDLSVTLKGSEYAGTQYMIYFNMQNNTLLQDKRVRQAISYATNREELSELCSDGYHPPGTTAISPLFPYWYNPDVSEPWFNLTRANELLDEAGYPKDQDGKRFSLRFLYNIGFMRELDDFVEIFYDQMQDVGIDIELMPLDRAAFFDKTWMQWDYDLSIWTSITGPDPSTGIGRLYHSRQIKPGFYINCMGYNNSEVDALLDEASTVLDPEERQALYFEVQEILAEDVPVLNVLYRPYLTAYRTTFKGIPYGVWGYRDPMDEVWWTLATGTSPPGGQPGLLDLPMEAYIAIIVVIVVVVAGLAVYYLRRKK